MIPIESQREAYSLDSNLLMFHDWRFVYPSYPGWVAPEGVDASVFSKDKMPDALLDWRTPDMPVGIRLVAQRPKLEPREGPSGWIINEQSRYRMWYIDTVRSDSPQNEQDSTIESALCYAESADGNNWETPNLDTINRPGAPQRNIVHIAPRGISGPCVFLDPDGPPEERYKSFYVVGDIGRQAEQTYREQRPNDIDRQCYRMGKIAAVCGSVSPEGLHWSALPQPLVMQQSDTHNLCYYDTVLRKYV